MSSLIVLSCQNHRRITDQVHHIVVDAGELMVEVNITLDAQVILSALSVTTSLQVNVQDVNYTMNNLQYEQLAGKVGTTSFLQWLVLYDPSQWRRLQGTQDLLAFV